VGTGRGMGLPGVKARVGTGKLWTEWSWTGQEATGLVSEPMVMEKVA
jgi:hypothetical protein